MKYLLMLLVLVACSSQETSDSTDASVDLKEKYGAQIGSATKHTFVQDFGSATWCKPTRDGLETCRYYRPLQTKWIGDGTDKRGYKTFDEVVATFDPGGKLLKFDANSQR